MATITGLIDRARLEVGDRGTPFSTTTVADGLSSRFELPGKPVDVAALQVFTRTPAGASRKLVPGTDYTLDSANGYVTFPVVPAVGTTIYSTGTSYKYFSPEEWNSFVSTAAAQHLHNRAGVTLANLDEVEEYPLALLAAIQALYVLVNDAAAQIDIATPEGVSIPKHQRYEQLMQMLIARQEQYNKLASMLNVGLGRIEMFNLRRVSRMTGRLVPVYQAREIDDTRMPNRQFPAIDLGGGSDVPGANTAATLDITFRAGNHYELPLDFSFDLTGYTVKAAVRRYPGSSRLREFDVEVTDVVAGQVTLSLEAAHTRHLPHQCFWDLFLRDPSGNENPYLQGRCQVERARAHLTQGYGA